MMSMICSCLVKSNWQPLWHSGVCIIRNWCCCWPISGKLWLFVYFHGSVKIVTTLGWCRGPIRWGGHDPKVRKGEKKEAFSQCGLVCLLYLRTTEWSVKHEDLSKHSAELESTEIFILKETLSTTARTSEDDNLHRFYQTFGSEVVSSIKTSTVVKEIGRACFFSEGSFVPSMTRLAKDRHEKIAANQSSRKYSHSYFNQGKVLLCRLVSGNGRTFIDSVTNPPKVHMTFDDPD